MLLALILTATPAGAAGEVPRITPRLSRTDGAARVSRSGSESFAALEFAPLSGAGIPGVGCFASSAVKGANGESITFTRASTGMVPSADGQTWTQCSADQIRLTPGSLTSPGVGYLQETAATNQVFYPSDLTQANWVKTNMTCTKTVTGPSGAANSASRCTSSAGNGQFLQTGIGGTNGTSIQSVFVRRTTGTGTVLITGDNFVTSTDIGPNLSSTVWKRVVSREAVGCADGACIQVPSMAFFTATPFVSGIRLGTSGDAIDVWAFQVEVPTTGDATAQPLVPSTPIDDNSGVRGARSLDRLYITPNTNFAVASMSAQVQMMGIQSTFGIVLNPTDGASVQIMYFGAGGTVDQRIRCDRSSSAGGSVPPPFSARTFLPINCELASASTITVKMRGYPDTVVSDAVANLTANKIQIGGRHNTTGFDFNGVIKSVCADPVLGRCAPTNFSTIGDPIAWVGDSITYGNAGSVSTAIRPPYWLSELLKTSTLTRAVQNLGIGGNTSSQCLSNWTNNVRGKGYKTLVLMCGVNDLIGAVAPATIWANLQTILDQAKADGMTVIPMTVLPYFGAPNPNLNTLNASITSWCSTNGVTCVDTYNSVMRTGDALTAIYDSGDGLHPNVAGSQKLAELVQAASP
jgi:lysophospholipase L1-like esterase